MNAQLPWYVARSAGLVAWGLLAAATFWGLALSTRILRRPRANWILDLHRWLGGLALVFTGVHVVALLLDSYVSFGLVEVTVPLASHWHPVAVAWGIVGAYLLLAVELTSLARSRLPRGLWRRVHYASFPLFVSATAHGLSAGTDTKAMMAKVAAIAAGSVFVGLTAARVSELVYPEAA
jgi:predicted ferric reductase